MNEVMNECQNVRIICYALYEQTAKTVNQTNFKKKSTETTSLGVKKNANYGG